MATRGIIARRTADGWEGRYHHWDSYPAGLGKALYDRYQQLKSIKAMTKQLIDDHPAGWSTIVCCDWSHEPGFIENSRDWLGTTAKDRPQCYCHGDRHEPEQLMTSDDTDTWCEYCYVLYSAGMHDYMDILASRSAGWEVVETVCLDGPEPAWDQLG